jgi:hypothetical protein
MKARNILNNTFHDVWWFEDVNCVKTFFIEFKDDLVIVLCKTDKNIPYGFEYCSYELFGEIYSSYFTNKNAMYHYLDDFKKLDIGTEINIQISLF